MLNFSNTRCNEQINNLKYLGVSANNDKFSFDFRYKNFGTTVVIAVYISTSCFNDEQKRKEEIFPQAVNF